jgi:hypothetical protein
MARIARSDIRQDGTYQFLLEREEERVRRFAHNAGTVWAYPTWRLEALLTGRPVDVPMWVLPEWAQLPGAVRVGHPMPRAVVYADDRIEVKPSHPGQWLDDRGLLGDESREREHARREYDMNDMSWGPFRAHQRGRSNA